MFKSWKIGQLAGIGIHLHWTFFLLPALVVVQVLAGGGAIGAAVNAVVFVLAIFGCVVLHELGHALTARRFGIATRDITLLPIGGVARLDRMPKNPWQELAIAAAGPAVNVAIAVALIAGLVAGSLLTQTPAAATLAGSWFVNLIWINIALVVFNLLPAFPMDGGRVLRSLLAMSMPHLRATKIAASIGQVLAVGLAIVGLFVNPMLTLVALFVFLAARGEARMAELEEEWRMADGIRWLGPVTSVRPACSRATGVESDRPAGSCPEIVFLSEK
jgi:Zn-dependent protease